MTSGRASTLSEDAPLMTDNTRAQDDTARRTVTSDELVVVSDESDSELKLDLRAVWSALYRNRYLLLIVMALALGAGLAITMLTTPIYEATSSVQIEQQAARVLENDIDTAGEGGKQDADRFLQTQLDVLRSRSLADRVARSLNLYRDNQFLLAMDQDAGTGTGTVLGSQNAQRRRVVNTLLSNMSVSLPRDSRVAIINFQSPSPQVAQRIANSYAENFIIANLQRKYDSSAYARNFLQEKLAEAKQRLEDSERESIAYSRSARLIDTSAGSATNSATGGGSRSLVTSSLVQTNDALTNAANQRLAAEQRWRLAEATPLMSLPEVQANPTIQSLVRDRSTLQAQYSEERTRRKDDHPTIRQISAQIGTLDAQIARLAGQVRGTIRDAYRVAQQQEQALRGTVQKLQGATLAEQDRSVQLNILRREVDTSRTLYDGLLQRYREVSAAAGITANNISVVDEAELPAVPILPRPMMNIALALLLGLAIAMVLIFARETFDDSIRSPEDVDQKLGVSFLGAIPLLPGNARPSEAMAEPRSSFSEAHYALRSSLQFATSTGLPRTLLCTSSLQSEGKSTTTTALARSFARIGLRVLLIDGDMRKPSQHGTLGLPNLAGLSTVLTRQRTLAEVTQPTDTPGLDFVACGPIPPNPGELLASASIDDVIDDAVSRYDLVIVDGPPVMGLADAPLLASAVEGVVFIIEASRAHRGQAKIALRRLRAAKATLLGVVLTKFDARQIGYGADYGYGYRYNYGGKQPARRSWWPFGRGAESTTDDAA